MRADVLYHFGIWAKKGNPINFSGDALQYWAMFVRLAMLLSGVADLLSCAVRTLYPDAAKLLEECATSLWSTPSVKWPAEATRSDIDAVKSVLKFLPMIAIKLTPECELHRDIGDFQGAPGALLYVGSNWETGTWPVHFPVPDVTVPVGPGKALIAVSGLLDHEVIPPKTHQEHKRCKKAHQVASTLGPNDLERYTFIFLACTNTVCQTSPVIKTK